MGYGLWGIDNDTAARLKHMSDLIFQAQNTPLTQNPGIIERSVQIAIGLHCGVDQRPDLHGIGDVGLDVQSLSTARPIPILPPVIRIT